MKTSVVTLDPPAGSDQAWQQLGPQARVLLASDGTLTDLLEALGGEPVSVRKLREETSTGTPDAALLGLDAHDWLVERVVLLQGLRSARPFVHARVLIVANRLTGRFRDDLLGSEVPIGKLWRRHRVELFREPIRRGCGPAGTTAVLLDCDAGTPVWSRTMRVQERGRPVMLITETFAPALVARAG